MKRAAVATLLIALACAAPATAKTEVATDGTVRGELTYTERKAGPPRSLVERVYVDDELVATRRFRDQYPGGFDDPSVRVVDLDGDGRGEVIFDRYSGGAHCCFSSDIYDGARREEAYWGNAFYRLKDFDGDGTPELSTVDDRFFYRYSSFVASLPPLRVFDYADGRLADFTKDPSVAPRLQKDAAAFRRVYQRQRRRNGVLSRELVVSALAGYTADRCSLGDCGAGFALVRRARARGDNRKFSRFEQTLRKDMLALGYTA